MAKLSKTYIPKDFRLYIPTGMRKVMDINTGDVADWYYGTDSDAIRLMSNPEQRQQVIVIHVRDSRTS